MLVNFPSVFGLVDANVFPHETRGQLGIQHVYQIKRRLTDDALVNKVIEVAHQLHLAHNEGEEVSQSGSQIVGAASVFLPNPINNTRVPNIQPDSLHGTVVFESSPMNNKPLVRAEKETRCVVVLFPSVDELTVAGRLLMESITMFRQSMCEIAQSESHGARPLAKKMSHCLQVDHASTVVDECEFFRIRFAKIPLSVYGIARTSRTNWTKGLQKLLLPVEKLQPEFMVEFAAAVCRIDSMPLDGVVNRPLQWGSCTFTRLQ